MTVSEGAWAKYIEDLRKINDIAAEKMAKYLETHALVTYEDVVAAVDYGYALATKYGEGAAELACEMYDAMAAASGVTVPAAAPAATATYGEIAKTLQGIMKVSQNVEMLSSAVGRAVKTAGVDTTIQNAIRDGAQFAWIPQGDTCAFCLTLASRGWQYASKKALKNGHAEHIHSNCDCTYAVRFNDDTDVQGYDPNRYLRMYNATDGTPKEKINAMRRDFYAENKEEINAQKRSAYEKRKERESSSAEELNI